MNKYNVKKLMFLTIGAAICLSILIFIPTANAATINVPGDYSTIQAAVTAASPYDTIVVAAGTYNEMVSINKPITLLGANAGIHPTVGVHPTETVGTRGPESILSHNGLYAISPSADDITIDGFKFTGTGGRIIDTYSDANSFSLLNCIFDNPGDHGATGNIQLGGGSHNDLLFAYNIFIDGGWHTFYAGGGPYDRMHIIGNTFNGYGEAIFWAASPLVDAVVEYNEFNGVYDGVPGDGGAYMNIGQGGNMIIRNNWFHDLFYTGSQVGIINGEVTDNIFENIYTYPGYWGTCFELWGGQYGTAVSENVIIEGNDFYYNEIAGAAEPTHGLRLRATETGNPGIDGSTIHVHDNNFYDGEERTDAYAVWHQADDTVDATCNWWSDSTGPYDPVLNPAGLGSILSGSVAFDPWLDAPYPYGNCGCTPICRNVEDNIEYCTIQGAIDAATTTDGETIEIYVGTHVEQVEVYKELTIYGQGVGTTTIQSPDNLVDYFPTGSNSNFPVVYIHNINGVELYDLTVDGAGKGNANYRFVGIGIYEAGAMIHDVDVIGVRDTPFSGAQHGVAIYGWSDGTGISHTIILENCDVYDYQKTGIALGGSDLTVDINNCIVTGFGPTTVTAQNGIQVSYGAVGSITENTISGCSYTGFNWAASGILPYLAGGVLDISDNIISENQANIYLCACSADITGNTVTASATGTGQTYFYGIIGDPGDPPIIPDAYPLDEGTPPIEKLTYVINCMNNVVTGDGTSGGVGIGVYAGMYGTYDIEFTANYNDVFDWGVGFELYEYAPNELISADINYNNIVGNDYGIYNWLTTTFNAQCNWWGDISGPSGFGPGTGDYVSDYLIYCTWLDDAYPYGDCIGGAVCWNIDTGEYFCSIQHAIDDADTDDGDTIEVFAGTHPGNIIVYKEVTIISQDGAASTIVDASMVDYSWFENSYGHGINYDWAENNDPGLLKNGFMIWSDDVTIDGFTIINAAWPSQYNRGIGVLIGSISTTYAGFIPWNIDQWGGIVSNPDAPTPTNIVIQNNIIDAPSDGIYNWASDGNLFENNTIYDTDPFGGCGIQVYEGGTDNIIQENTIYNAVDAISICGAWPDVLLDVSDTEIYDNLLTNNVVGIKFYNVYGSNLQAYNNNILDNDRGVVVEGVGGALVGHANYNNIVGNTEAVVNTAPDGIFDAECNWYGTPFGPMHPSNPAGTGNPVSDNVDYLPWLNLPFEDPNSICGAGLCQDVVYVDDDFTTSTPGYYVDHFSTLQLALDRLSPYGTAVLYDGVYSGEILIDDDFCDNTGITIMGDYGCFPGDVSAVINGNFVVLVDDVTIQYLEFNPDTDGSIIVDGDVNMVSVECCKFNKDCVADAVGVDAHPGSLVDAVLNWWGRPDGPDGGVMDDGKSADGFGVKVFGDVYVEPWVGIHAEIVDPVGTVEVEVGTSVGFDGSGSWAYSFGDCCEPTLLHMQFEWDFGDGAYSHNMMASHVFETPGTYEVSLRLDSPGITGLYGNIMYDWDYLTVHVVQPGTPLTASADGPGLDGGYETLVGEPVQLFGDAFGGNGEYQFSWDFGDNSAYSTDQNPTHVYTYPGTYTVTLSVTSGGESASDTAEVVVYDVEELVVDVGRDLDAIVGDSTMFTVNVIGGVAPYEFVWSFGDGSTSTDRYPVHVYDRVGEYTVKVVVTDADGKSRMDELLVVVVEDTSVIEEVEIVDVSGGFGLSALIASGDFTVDWMISVDGLVFVGGYSDGLLGSGMSERVRLPLTLGFGQVTVMVEANELVEEYSAFLIGPFFLGLQQI